MGKQSWHQRYDETLAKEQHQAYKVNQETKTSQAKLEGGGGGGV